MTGEKVKVWDVGVRIFHWSLVILFFVSYFTGEEENLLHIYAGYGVLGLIAFRIVWGFVGTKHARFSDFIYGTKTIFQYVKSLFTAKPDRYLGHNPLAGWMVIALLICLIGVSWSGLELYAAEGRGPLANQQYSITAPVMANDDKKGHDNDSEDKHENEEAGDLWEDIHETFANLTLLLVFIHIVGALTASTIHRENLIKAMITGYKSTTKH